MSAPQQGGQAVKAALTHTHLSLVKGHAGRVTNSQAPGLQAPEDKSCPRRLRKSSGRIADASSGGKSKWKVGRSMHRKQSQGWAEHRQCLLHLYLEPFSNFKEFFPLDSLQKGNMLCILTLAKLNKQFFWSIYLTQSLSSHNWPVLHCHPCHPCNVLGFVGLCVCPHTSLCTCIYCPKASVIGER